MEKHSDAEMQEMAELRRQLKKSQEEKQQLEEKNLMLKEENLMLKVRMGQKKQEELKIKVPKKKWLD